MSTTQRDAIRYFCQQKGMTEEELADEINKAFEQPTGEELIHVLNKGAAIGRREMLDKACEWLENTFHDRSHHSGRGDAGEIVTYDFDSMQEFILKFCKAMEE